MKNNNEIINPKMNMQLANEKGLIGEKYNQICQNYKYVLEYYLNSVIDFQKYEDEINHSDLYIGENSKYKVLDNYFNFNYIHLINRLFIEKLDKKDISLLQRIDKKNISTELISMIKRTFKKVIYDNYLDSTYVDKIYKVCYGPFVPINFVDNDSLVFKIYYGRNKKKILDTKEFITLDKKQVEFFEKMINELKSDVNTKLDVKCEVLLEKDIN